MNQISVSYLFAFFFRLVTDNIYNWTGEEEDIGSLQLYLKVANRFRLIMWGKMFQVFDEYALLINRNQIITLGLNNGMIIFEDKHYSQSIVKHPSLPLIFEYPVSVSTAKVGRFMVTPEAGYDEEKLLGDRHLGYNCNYSRLVEAKLSTSRKKRLPDFEDSEEERTDPNFLM